MTARGGQIVLAPGQVAVCVHCHAIAECGYIDTDERCIECGQGGVVVRDVLARGRKAIAARWGEDVARTGFVATPNVLVEHAMVLGLSAVDLQLLNLIELHRRDSDEAWPSEDRLAQLAGGIHVATVRAHLRRLRQAGLIEVARVRDRGGRFEHNVYTRHGLAEVAQLIASNRRAGHADLDGLPEMLRSLAERAADHRAPALGGATESTRSVDHRAPARGGGTTERQRSSPPSASAHHHRAPALAEAEAVEAEAEETDSPNGASNAPSRVDGPLLLIDVLGSEEAVGDASAGEDW